MRRLSRLVATVLVCGLLVGVGVATAFAGGGGDTTEQVGSQRITISDATVTVSNTTIRGTGLPNLTLTDQTITVERSTTTVSGLQFTVGGTTYEFGRTTVVVDDVGVRLEAVRLVGE
ncbi:hypothetical protein [Halomicrococcus gelatinilyticus]|uniref:hypothetical protein n=1 Tax=Halomicrococcus gelatinilyticus TaxID=1702103 RepID=UPI002E0E50B9